MSMDMTNVVTSVGIHGRPFVDWDNVHASPGDDQTGYCTHASILFPTWHRPYLALYEVRAFSCFSLPS